jgi:hypothetical protein
MTTPYKSISSAFAALGIAALSPSHASASPVDGSLWLGSQGTEHSMFSDKVASHIGGQVEHLQGIYDQKRLYQTSL